MCGSVIRLPSAARTILGFAVAAVVFPLALRSREATELAHVADVVAARSIM
jgi:hypothetical protein